MQSISTEKVKNSKHGRRLKNAASLGDALKVINDKIPTGPVSGQAKSPVAKSYEVAEIAASNKNSERNQLSTKFFASRNQQSININGIDPKRDPYSGDKNGSMALVSPRSSINAGSHGVQRKRHTNSM